jgi:hypothetical protein
MNTYRWLASLAASNMVQTARKRRMSHIWIPQSGPTPWISSSTQSNLQTVRIDVPLGSEHLVLIIPHEDEERQASAMENWLQACASDQPFSLELVGTRREQGFVLRASSEEQLVLLCKQFAAQYPQAELQRIAPAADPLVLHADEHALVGAFALTQPSWMPLKTFTGKMLAEPGADPLAGLLAAMEPLGSGERIICQLALVHTPEHWIARHIRKAVEHPLQAERDAAMKGTQPSSSSKEGIKTLLLAGGLFSALLAYRWYNTHAWFPLTLLVIAALLAAIGFLWWRARQSQQEIYDMKMVSEKLSRAAFYTSLRVIVIGKRATSRTTQLRAHLMRLEVAYRQFTLASANSLALKRVVAVTPDQRQAAVLIQADSAFPYHHWVRRLLHGGAWSPDVWNSLEVSGAFHLPQSLTDLPLVRRLSVKHLLASPEIARHLEQETVPMPAALVGFSRHRGYTVPVYLPYQTLFSHLFLVARSRYGKSTLIQLLARAALHQVTDGSLQPGLFIIDPHKDLVDDLLYAIPRERASDVVLLDLTDTQQVVALNPLDASMGWSRDQAIANLMSCFERIWHDFWGPRMAYFLKAVCLLLYTLNQKKVQQGQREAQYTLLDINPLLQYPDYAVQVLSELDLAETWHQELLAWWQQVYFALPRQSSFRSEVIMPIISKMGVFSDNQQLRRIVGQPVTKAPVHEAITEGKVVLCALSAREMDEAAVNVLGSTLINLLHRGFGMQQQVPLEARRKVFCAVDEFHAFSGGDFDRLLSEDAKFGCALLLATQNLKRLNHIREGLLEMVLSNCDNLFAFNVSAADAKLVEEELRGQVEQRHIIAQPRFHCYTRLSLPGYPLQIFSMTLATPPSWQRSIAHQQQATAIRQDNVRRHTTPASEVDQRYADHLKQFLDVRPFAQKVQRDAREAAYGKQERAAADQLEHEQRKQAPAPASSGMPQPSSASSAQQKERDGTPAGIGSSLAGGSSARKGASAQDQEGQNGKRKNHLRSKRRKFTKDPVGLPPPDPSLDPSEEQPNFRPHVPLRGLGSWSSWGGERERGE